ncbi:hypothetical protein Tco_0900355 [Tanacetum coccineum]
MNGSSLFLLGLMDEAFGFRIRSRCKGWFEKTFWAAQKVSSRAAEIASQVAGGYRWVSRDESAGSDGQPGG